MGLSSGGLSQTDLRESDTMLLWRESKLTITEGEDRDGAILRECV